MAKNENELVLDGFLFSTEAQYTRAKKEKEMIGYLTANTPGDDMKAWLKVYNKAVEKKSFQTIIGQQFLSNLQDRLAASQLVTRDALAPIPAASAVPAGRRRRDPDNAQAERYKNLYENAVADQKIKNLLIGVLIVVIIGMIVITGTSRYSVFTYFTDYETKIREQVTDEMEDWQKELEQKEQELKAREGGESWTD